MSDEGKLFIGGLSYDTDEDSLNNSFIKYGAIEKVAVIRDRENGSSRGFGFVTFSNPDDAKDAMLAMNGQEIDGRTIRVDEAGKNGNRRGSGSRGFGAPRGRGRGNSRGGGGYGDWSYDRSHGDRGYGDRGYSDRSYGDRGYSDRNYGGEDRSFRDRSSNAGYGSGSRDRGYGSRGSRSDGKGGYASHGYTSP